MAAPLLAGIAGRVLGSLGLRAGAGAAAGGAARGSLARDIALSGRRGQNIGEILRMRGAEEETAGDAVRKFGVTVAKGGLALTVLTLASGKLSTALLLSRQKFAQFDSRIAAVFARFELAEIRRTFATAQATSGSTEILGDAVNDLKDEFQPIRELGTNIANLGGTALAKLGQGITFIANKALFLEEINDGLKGLLNQGEERLRPDVAAFRIFAGRPIDKERFKK